MFGFEEYQGSFYLIEEAMPLDGRRPMGQKLPPLPPINEAWKKRIGKKYIVCDAHPDDLVLNDDGFYVTIKEYENEDGLLFFLHPKPYDMTPLPVITSGDNETEMVLNTPLGSRDGFAPFIYEKGGKIKSLV